MQAIRLLCLVLAAAPAGAVAGSYDDFFSAVEQDKAYVIERLLARGFDPNAVDPSGQTGLCLALQGEDFKAADLLLKQASLDVNALNAAGESALMIAALKGQTQWVERLLARGTEVNKTGWTPLHYAASGMEPRILKLLLDRHAEVDARSPNGTTPLMMAAQYGSEANVDVLLARGADPRIKNARGLDASDFARRAQRDELATRLDRLSAP